MGLGIRTSDGADPLDAWRLRLQRLGNDQLSDSVRDLLAGGSVESSDGVLEISSRPLLDPHTVELIVRIPRAPYVARLVVRATDEADGDRSIDPRSPFPAPDRWRTVVSDTRVTWELFNCVAHRLASRENAPA